MLRQGGTKYTQLLTKSPFSKRLDRSLELSKKMKKWSNLGMSWWNDGRVYMIMFRQSYCLISSGRKMDVQLTAWKNRSTTHNALELLNWTKAAPLSWHSAPEPHKKPHLSKITLIYVYVLIFSFYFFFQLSFTGNLHIYMICMV